MRLRTILMFSNGDQHILNRMNEALNLVGYQHLYEESDGDKMPEDLRSIRRLRGSSGDYADLARVEAYIVRRAAELNERADKDVIFPDPKVNAMFADGVRSTARLALRKWREFRDLIEEDLSETSERVFEAV